MRNSIEIVFFHQSGRSFSPDSRNEAEFGATSARSHRVAEQHLRSCEEPHRTSKSFEFRKRRYGISYSREKLAVIFSLLNAKLKKF